MALNIIKILLQDREQFRETAGVRDARHDNIRRDGWPRT